MKKVESLLGLGTVGGGVYKLLEMRKMKCRSAQLIRRLR